jgi:hypothetical protein
MIRTLKKLKIWSKFKRKKHQKSKQASTQNQRPCKRTHCNCSSCKSNYTSPPWLVAPSAPPLPSEQPTASIFTLPEISPLFGDLGPRNNGTTTSYQQYFVPSPVYNVVPSDIPAGMQNGWQYAKFGCVYGIFAVLFKCFVCCFR